MLFALSARWALPSLRYLPPVPHLAAAEDQTQEKGADDGVWKLDESLRFATELAGRRARRKGWEGLAAEMRAAGWNV
jgi:hypothetical protein